MGAYIYSRQSEVIEATESLAGMKMFINVFKYETKPFWDIWSYGPSPYDTWEKRVDAVYARIRRNAYKRFNTLKANNKLSNFAVVGDFRKSPSPAQVYQEDDPQAFMVDDAWIGCIGKRVGTLSKQGRKWVFTITELSTQSVPKAS